MKLEVILTIRLPAGQLLARNSRENYGEITEEGLEAPGGVREATNKELQVCARRRDGELAGHRTAASQFCSAPDSIEINDDPER